MEEGEGQRLRSNVIVMSIGNTIAVSANSLWIMFVPYFFADAGVSPFFIGLIFTAVAVSRALSSLVGGRVADIVGRKPIISIGYLLYLLGPLVILFSLVFVPTSLFLTACISSVGYVCMSAGGGFQGPASSMMLVESSPEKQRGLSYMFTTRFLPSIPPAVLVLYGTDLYLSNQFWFALVLGFFGLFFVFILFTAALHESHTRTSQIQEDAPRTSRVQFDLFLLLLIIAFALDGISSRGLSWYVPIFVGRSNLSLYGVMISVSTLVIAFSALISGGLVDRIGTRATIFGGWTLLAVTVFLFPLSSEPLEFLVLYSIWAGLDMMDVSVPPLAIAERYPKEKRASVLGLYSMSVSLLGMAGPALISLSLLLGNNVPFYLKAIMNMAGALLFLLAFKTGLEKKDNGGNM